MSLAGWFFDPTQFYQSYLMAYMFCLSVTLGCLALGMVHQLSGGAWGVVIRRPIGAATRVLPVMTLLFVPVVLGMSHLYIWTHADVVAHDDVLQAKHRVSERAVFPRARGDLFRVVERHRVFPERVVARTGPQRRSADRAEDAAA